MLSTPLAAVLAANDWPQFLGPSRNGAYVGAPLNEKWPSTGPRIIWRKQIGQGLSGPVVAGKRLILFHRVDDREVVESFDALTGAAQWRHAYPTTYRDDFGFDEGPRAVPVVADGMVFTYGAEGKLHAVDLATGKPLWNVDAMRQFDVAKGFFGAAGSPLVEGGKVIANVGGKKGGIVAFDAKTGKVLWTDNGPAINSRVSPHILGGDTPCFTRANLLDGSATGQVRVQRACAQAGGIGERREAIVAGTESSVGRVGPGAVVLHHGRSSRTYGCRMRCSRTTTQRACCTTDASTDFTAVRSSARYSARSICRAERYCGAPAGSVRGA